MAFALVTGASKGIGKAIAGLLAGRGYDLLLIARSGDLLEKTSSDIHAASGRTCYWLALDLAGVDSAQILFNWVKENNYEVSVLVNNAGYGLSGKFESWSLEEHTEMLQVNIVTLTQLTRLFLPELLKRSSSYILNIGSSASYQAVPLLSAYAASKAYVLSFSRGLYQELKNTVVSVTCVCPGPTDTNFVTRANVGEKGRKTAERFNMTADRVAQIATEALFSKKPELITGALNKLNAVFAWLLPKTVVEQVAKKLYD